MKTAKEYQQEEKSKAIREYQQGIRSKWSQFRQELSDNPEVNEIFERLSDDSDWVEEVAQDTKDREGHFGLGPHPALFVEDDGQPT